MSNAPVPFVRLAIGVAALLAATAASGEIYRSVLPDGRVVYSDSPPADAARTETVDVPPPPTPEERAEAAAVESAIEQAGQTVRDPDRSAGIGAADAEVRAAERDLAAARKRLEEGKVEREGDRIGIVGRRGGGARLSDAYWQRVGGLEIEVQAAEERLKTAREAARQARR
jgi:hypothetical protein